MASYNKVTILGYVGQDPELNKTKSGTAVLNMSVATNRQYGEGETDWHSVVVWGEQAKTVDQYVSKGDQVFVEGDIRYDSYEDRDGNRRNTVEIHANRVVFLGGGGNSSSSTSRKSRRDEEGGDVSEDDLPF